MSQTTAVVDTEAPPTTSATEVAWAGPPAGATPPTALAADPAPPAPPAPPEQPPAPVPAAPAAKPPRRNVRVPMWLVGVVAALVLVVGAFVVGRESAPDSASSPSGPTTLAEAVEETAKGDMPVGEFDVQDLIDALRQNGNLNLDLQDILDLLGR